MQKEAGDSAEARGGALVLNGDDKKHSIGFL